MRTQRMEQLLRKDIAAAKKEPRTRFNVETESLRCER